MAKDNKETAQEYFKEYLNILGLSDEIIEIQSEKVLFSEYLTEKYQDTQFWVGIAKIALPFIRGGLMDGGVTKIYDFFKYELERRFNVSKEELDLIDLIDFMEWRNEVSEAFKTDLKKPDMTKSFKKYMDLLVDKAVDGVLSQYEDKNVDKFVLSSIDKIFKEDEALGTSILKDDHPTKIYLDKIKERSEKLSTGQAILLNILKQNFVKQYVDGTEWLNDMIDTALSKALDLLPIGGNNNISLTPGKKIEGDLAHAYMQLINWSALGKLPPGIGFDPKNDPFPEDPDKLDDYISRNFKLVEQFKIGYVKGSIFKAPGLGFFHGL